MAGQFVTELVYTVEAVAGLAVASAVVAAVVVYRRHHPRPGPVDGAYPQTRDAVTGRARSVPAARAVGKPGDVRAVVVRAPERASLTSSNPGNGHLTGCPCVQCELHRRKMAVPVRRQGGGRP